MLKIKKNYFNIFSMKKYFLKVLYIIISNMHHNIFYFFTSCLAVEKERMMDKRGKIDNEGLNVSLLGKKDKDIKKERIGGIPPVLSHL